MINLALQLHAKMHAPYPIEMASFLYMKIMVTRRNGKQKGKQKKYKVLGTFHPSQC